MVKKDFKLTQAGIDELKAEHEELVSRRKDVAEKLKTARDLGDLKENTEYHNARDEQANLETRISEIQNILRNVEVIKKPRNKTVVELGDKIVLSSKGPDKTVMIVGSVEANPAEDKISNESPIGQLLMGKKVGEKVIIAKPAGKSVYTIKKIS